MDEELLALDGPAPRPGPLKPLLPPVGPNWGVACNSTEPDFATWWLRLFKLSTEPRAMPIPADPFLTTIRNPALDADTRPPLPTTTVLTIPVGATGGRKLEGRVPAVRGTTFHVVKLPGCHIQPNPGRN